MLKNFALVLAGVAGATAFILACSDDSPGDADAAVCDCPAAEPPLAGRITRVEKQFTGAQAFYGPLAACPDNSTLLGGGCYAAGVGEVSVTLTSSGAPGISPDPSAYQCKWTNPSATEVTVTAWATCLTPAAQ